MKLNPQHAPLYGDCVVTILLTEEDKVEDDVVFYLVFSGSTLHHCTSTRKISSDTLETIAPSHDCCETVKVLLCASKEGLPVFVVAQEDFRFIQDEAYDAAQFLATSAGNQQALNFTRFLDRSGPPSGDVNSLDQKVALAFRHLKLPAEWNVLGTDQTLHDGVPRETLMHFAVRLGLLRLTWFLLQKPGGRGALSVHNQEGATPVSLALERGYHQLHQLLTEENAGEPESWSSLSHEISCGDCSVRHHRELDIYTITSDSQSHQDPPGDHCDGRISKLRSIQQQLMKTNLKQMDSLTPLVAPAQDPSGLPSAPHLDGLSPPSASETVDSQPLPPPPKDTGRTLCCQGSTAKGWAKRSNDLSSVVKEENTGSSCEEKKKGVESGAEEMEPAPFVDSGTVSEAGHCLQSMPDSGKRDKEDCSSSEDRSEGSRSRAQPPGTSADQECLSSGSHVMQEDLATEPSPAQVFSGGELAVSATTSVTFPEASQEAEHDLMNPDTTFQKNVLEAGEGTEQRTENASICTPGASDVKATSKPMDKTSVPNCVFANSALDGGEAAESLLACSHGETSAGNPAESGPWKRRHENSADAPVSQTSSVTAAAAEHKLLDGADSDLPLAGVGEDMPASHLAFLGLETDLTPNQTRETTSPPVQSPSGTGDGRLCVDSAGQQSTVISNGELSEPHAVAAQPEDIVRGQPPPAHSENPQADTVLPNSARDTSVQDSVQTPVGLCLSEVSASQGQVAGLNPETPLTHVCHVASHPPVPQPEQELVPGRAVTPDSPFSLASKPGSESVTQDDVLSVVPSQKGKGTATLELQQSSDCRDDPGGDSHDPTKQLLEDSTAGQTAFSLAAELQPSMGNTSPVGSAEQHEGPCPPAVPHALNVTGLGTESAPATDVAPAGEGDGLAVPGGSAAQGPDDAEQAAVSPFTQGDAVSSGALLQEERSPPPGPAARGLHGDAGSAARAQGTALERSHSLGTPSAWLSAEAEHNKEVAPQGSLLTREGGTAQISVPPGAGLTTGPGPEAAGRAPSIQPPPPGRAPAASGALRHSRALDQNAALKDTRSLGETAAREVSGEATLGAAVAGARRDTVGVRRKDDTHDTLRSHEGNVIPSLPGACPARGVSDPQVTATPAEPPRGREEGALQRSAHTCTTDNSQQTQMDAETNHGRQQSRAEELPTEAGLSTPESRSRPGPGGKDVGPCGAGSAPALPSTVSSGAERRPLCADLLEEAASRIVDAVIERVRSSGALLADGATSPPGSGPVAEHLETVSAAKASTFLPEEAPQLAGVCGEAPARAEGCSAEKEEPETVLLPLQGPEPATEMPDMKAEDEVDFLSNSRESSVSEEVAGGSRAVPTTKQDLKPRAINQESWCAIEPCPEAASLLASKQNPECKNFLDVELGGQCGPTHSGLKRESVSDSDLFRSPSGEMDSMVFSKPEEEQSICDIAGSSSSTDDTASLDRHSSHGSDVSLPPVSNLNKSKDPQSLNDLYSQGPRAVRQESENEPAGPGDTEEEEMDSITEVPANCSVLRGSMRSLSPFRRHSWGPGKNAASDAEMNHRSSMRVLGDVVRRPPIHRRSMSWCPSGVQYSAALSADFSYRSFSLEGLTGGTGVRNKPPSSLEANSANPKPFGGEERGDSLVSLSEEDLESGQREQRMFDHQTSHRSKQKGFNYCTSAISSPLTKSISLMTISHPGLDNTRIFHNTSANLTESITEENFHFLPPSPSKKDFEGKSGTKVSRTFSYIRSKMSSSKKSKEKEKEKDKTKEKEKDSKEKDKDKKTVNGHTFGPIPVVGPVSCSQCSKPFINKDAYTCANCGAFVHKGCRESLASCAKVKMKQPKGSLQAQDTSSLPTVIMRNKPSQPKERPRSAVLLADEANTAPMFANRRSQQRVSLSKSVSIQNIAGVSNDESMSNTWKFLSHSTDSLNKISKVNESTESLTDEGTDMNEGQLMGDFEVDSKQLEAESWSRIVDSKFLKQQKKDVIKQQEVIYELMQTEFHHIRTLKIMSDVYSRGMMTDLLFEQQMVEKLFPCLDELIGIHSQFFQRIVERKKESLVDKSERNFLIRKIGDVLVNQFSGENAERLKKTYGKFCGQHTQSVNYFKDLYTKDKRFQAFVKKKMSSSVVRRLGIPECILLVTQRITKYPVLFQRMLQYTKDNEVEQEDVARSLSLVKDVIGAVDSTVASYEKKVRLHEIYTKTDSKSIMRMKGGQMFAKEDLKRKKLVRDGSVFLKNSAGRLKEVQAVLLTDILVFLQEKDQKYVFASLEQKSTVISLKKLIVREVAHEEKGLFLISMGTKDPEMVEVHASSKEERNSWIHSMQDTINALNRDEDEGIPSENEEEKKMLDMRTRELREQLQQKDQQILQLLEEKETIFRDMMECSTPLPEECSPTHSPRALFRSNMEEALKGGPLMKNAISEVELLQDLVSGNLGGALGPAVSSSIEQDGTIGPVSLPRRAETFGGFDSHQMNVAKGGEKEEGDDDQDLRRTESDSRLKKGANANLGFMLKRNSEVIQSIAHLHELLSSLQGVVLQQDSYIEDQKLTLNERALTRSSSRPSSLVEQEKQRSLEKQRQDLANLHKQQAQHLEEKRRREREWAGREQELQEREARLAQREEMVQRGRQDLEKEREELQQKKGTYQCDLERLRAAQKQLERELEQLKSDAEWLGQRQAERDASQVSQQHVKVMKIPAFFASPEEPPQPSAPSLAKSGSLDSELSVSPKRNSISRTHKDKGPFHILSAASQTGKAAEGPSQAPAPTSTSARLFGLAKPKEKEEKKKRNKYSQAQPGDGPASEVPAEGEEIFC